VEDAAGIGIHHNGGIRRLVSAVATVGMVMTAGTRLCGIRQAAGDDCERGKADQSAMDCGQASRTMAAHPVSPSLATRSARLAPRTRRSLFALALP
jgi:hypothetical protein